MPNGAPNRPALIGDAQGTRKKCLCLHCLSYLRLPLSLSPSPSVISLAIYILVTISISLCIEANKNR